MGWPGEKLVIKLWETLVEKGIGKLLTPWQLGREGQARIELRRKEILALAQAEKEAEEIRAGRKQLHPDGVLLPLLTAQTDATVTDGKREPTLFLEHAVQCATQAALASAARSEINATRAVIFAEEQLAADDQEPPARDVDEDWLFTWRENAGKVSTEDLQRLWGSVLAGELKDPGTYSIRTLELLKTLSKSDAARIEKLASYVIGNGIVSDDVQEVQFDSLIALQELGILSGVEGGGYISTYRSVSKTEFRQALLSHNKVLLVEHADPTRELKLQGLLLTGVGKQLLGLGRFVPDCEYLRRVGMRIAADGFKVRLADWRLTPEGRKLFSGAQEISSDPPVAGR